MSVGRFDNYLDVFKSDNYRIATVQERMDAFQALEHDMAITQNRPERQIVFSDLEPGLCGAYVPDSDVILMNTDYLRPDGDQFDGMNTVIHEGRHAFQSDCMNGYCQPDSRLEEHLDSMKLEDLANPQTGKTIYSINYMRNPSEQDAFSYANDRMHSFDSQFSGDKAFETSCQGNDVRFINDTYDLQRETGLNLQDQINSRNAAKTILADPSASPAEKQEAENLFSVSEQNYNDILSDNYTDGRFDPLKSADNHVQNSAANLGYSSDQINSKMSENTQPTFAQSNTYADNMGGRPDIHPDLHTFDTDLMDRNSTGKGYANSPDNAAEGLNGAQPLQTESNQENANAQYEGMNGAQPLQTESNQENANAQYEGMNGAQPLQTESNQENANAQYEGMNGAQPLQTESNQENANAQYEGMNGAQPLQAESNQENANAQSSDNGYADLVNLENANAQYDGQNGERPFYVDANQDNSQSDGQSGDNGFAGRPNLGYGAYPHQEPEIETPDLDQNVGGMSI